MAGGDGGKLLGPGGQPIKRPSSGVVVLKCYNMERLPDPKFVAQIAKALGSSVIMLPSETDLLTGQVAINEVDRLHEAIHRLLELQNGGKHK